MAEQRLHSGLAPIDVLTRVELEAAMHAEFEAAIRSRFRGIDSARFPRTMTEATGATVFLGASANEAPCGPESGDVWLVRRVICKSNSLTDTARYTIFRGSSPSDTSNAYGPLQFIEGFNAPVAAPVPSQPAVPATGVAQQNVNPYPVQVVITAGGATISNVSVNGITVGTAAGTYTVPAFGAISIAYTVATPTWVWSNLNTATAVGLPVNIGYYPSTKSILLQPGEQIYAQITGATVNNVYVLDGEAIRVPAEMKGKVL